MTLKKGKLAYLKYGEGSALLIALHGHGESAKIFKVLEPALSKHYTVYAVDLPFHGKSRWESDVFDKADMAELFEALCFLEKKLRFSFMGFSFGARIGLALLPQFADRYETMYLLGPDGIDTPSLRKMFFSPPWLQALLHRSLKNPTWLLTSGRFLYKTGLLPKYNMTFLENNFARPHRVQRSFGMWRSLAFFKTSNADTIRQINEIKLPIHVFSAKNDPFIRFSTLEMLQDNIPTLRLFPMTTGHKVVNQELAEKLKSALN